MAGRVHIGMLSYGSAPSLNTFQSFMQSLEPLSSAGWTVTFSCRFGDGIITRARNSICREFLHRVPKSDVLVMLDDDIGWKPPDLVKLIEHKEDFVAGLYRYKMDEERYPVRWVNFEIWRDDETGLWEVETAPAGFIKLTRNCLEKMVAAYPELEYHDTATDMMAHALFDFELVDKVYWGEDFTFCRRWRAIGGNVMVDPTITLEHIGKQVYTGNIEDWIKRMPPSMFIRGEKAA